MGMAGYPAFVALIYALTGHTGQAARLWVMLAQVFVDLVTCLLTAGLAALLLLIAYDRARPQRVFIAWLWLAASFPFHPNFAPARRSRLFAMFFPSDAL